MKFTTSYDPWRQQPFYVPRQAAPKSPLPDFEHLRMTVPKRARSVHDALVTLIDSAVERVFVCSFLLGGETVRDALRRAAHRLRGHVYVVVALDERSLEKGLGVEPGDVQSDNLDRQIKSFESLTRHGIYVRGAENCHAKFCVVDDRTALVGSANFDPSGLGEEGGHPCGELGLVIEGQRAEPLARLFRHLWKCGCQREAPPLRNGYRLSGVAPGKESPPSALDGKDTLVWTGFASTAILAGIQSVVAAAKHQLVLASFSFTAMREKPGLLLDALAAARKRGVQVEMLLRDRARDLPEIAALLDIGVEVRANRDNHAKYAIADGERGLLFSANFDGVHGLTSGVETGVRLRPEEARETAQWHAHIWDEAPSQARRWSSPDDFAEVMPAIRQEVPAFLGSTMTISGDDNARSRCAAILKGPWVLVADGQEAEPRQLRLVGFDDVLRLERDGAGVEAFGLDRDDDLFCPLPRLIAMSRRRTNRGWLPLGLEVHLT